MHLISLLKALLCFEGCVVGWALASTLLSCPTQLWTVAEVQRHGNQTSSMFEILILSHKVCGMPGISYKYPRVLIEQRWLSLVFVGTNGTAFDSNSKFPGSSPG